MTRQSRRQGRLNSQHRSSIKNRDASFEPSRAGLAAKEGVGSSDAQDRPKPAIKLSRKDWHSPANRAVLWPVPGGECVPGSCPAGLLAEMGLRWWRRIAARNRMEDPDVKTCQQARQSAKSLTQSRRGKTSVAQPSLTPKTAAYDRSKRNRRARTQSKRAWSRCCVRRPALR